MRNRFPRLSSKYFSLPFVTVDKEEYEKKKLFMHVETWEKMYINLHYLPGFRIPDPLL